MIIIRKCPGLREFSPGSPCLFIDPLYSTASETPVVPAVIPANGLAMGEKTEVIEFLRPPLPPPLITPGLAAFAFLPFSFLLVLKMSR